MAPKKAKGKAIAPQEQTGAQPEEDFGPALIGTKYGVDVEKFRTVVAGRHNEHAATSVTPARFRRHASGLYPFFIHVFFVGLVMPFSSFMEEILTCYQICVLHLHPNAILTLALFVYLCEAYLGMSPSVAFFRSFYALWSTAPGESSGCLSLRIADEMSAIHIPMAWGADERPITRVTKKVEEFRQKWLLKDITATNTFYDVPEAPPMKHDGWSSEIGRASCRERV